MYIIYIYGKLDQDNTVNDLTLKLEEENDSQEIFVFSLALNDDMEYQYHNFNDNIELIQRNEVGNSPWLYFSIFGAMVSRLKNKPDHRFLVGYSDNSHLKKDARLIVIDEDKFDNTGFGTSFDTHNPDFTLLFDITIFNKTAKLLYEEGFLMKLKQI